MRALILALCLMSHGALKAVATTKSAAPTTEEAHRKTQLQNRLCADRELSCAYVTAILNDPRLTIYPPPEPAVPPPAPVPKEHERNPYFTKRFGLLTSESLERCKDFIQVHLLAFEAAYQIYGVPREVICGHLRIETNSGIPTKLSPNPLGTVPAIDRLVTLYVRRPSRKQPQNRFVQRQTFALDELKDLLRAARNFGWDLFQVPGSSTGEDAILSVAHYLVAHGWDGQPQHQQRAIYAYYGGHYSADPNKYYMKAVLKYADAMGNYLKDHPLDSRPTSFPEPLTPEERETSRDQRTRKPVN